ncbi:hypothetical protein CYCD_09400 [Tenuifilaceae bacterium CYCD]|nr:hypothetical protein CYCD_09400 [Tenuifilaceae bacterium CYCD]
MNSLLSYIYILILNLLISISIPQGISFKSKKNIVNKSGENLIVNIPLIRAGKLLLIEARIDDQIGNLVFDTGAEGIVLNSTYFRDYVKNESHSSQGVNGSVGSVQNITVDCIDIGDLSFKGIRADLIELGHIENSKGIKILGLFGFRYLRDYEVVIDVNQNQLTLIKVDKKGNRLLNDGKLFTPQKVEPISESNSIVFFTGLMAKKKVKFCLDTGAEISSISSSLSKEILSTVSITRRTKLMGSGSTKKEVLFGVMNEFRFADKDYSGMETILTNLSSLETVYNTQFGGIVGFDFLKKGVFSINIRKKQMGICFTNTKEI